MTSQTLPDTMQALVQDGYGDADVLRLGSLAVPTPGDGEVLVRVHAAGVDRGAWHLMTGMPHLIRPFAGLRRPRRPVPGRELSGTVVGVGAGITRFSPGDEVFGIGSGAFAQYAVAREAKLALKPAAASYEQAAVSPVTGLTALQALRAGGLAAGQRVLVVGASGGVGSFAVQLAVAEGAEVAGVASTAKLDLVRSLGATEVIDYTVDDFAAGGPRFDLVLDVGGLAPLSRLRSALKPTGTLVLVGGEGGGDFSGGTITRQLRARVLSLLGRRRLTGILCQENAADLEVLAQLIASGAVTPSVGGVYPLARGADAMRELADGKVRGKLAISLIS